MPLVLAETLLGLDAACSEQTKVFGGSPLHLQLGFSHPSPFSDFHSFFFPLHSAWLFLAPYLSYLSCKFGLCDKVGLLTMPLGNWVHEARLLSHRAFKFLDQSVANWIGYLGRLSA